jgi:hypothetical protein
MVRKYKCVKSEAMKGSMKDRLSRLHHCGTGQADRSLFHGLLCTVFLFRLRYRAYE